MTHGSPPHHPDHPGSGSAVAPGPGTPAPALDVPGYRTGSRIGLGSSGEVWSATDRATGQRVALKVLRVGRQAREQVLREAAVLRQVQSAHVVRLRSVVEVPGQGLVLVLEHADGGDLASVVAARGRLSPGEVVTVLAPLAQTLSQLHQRGLLHADVSPSNVLFDGDGRPMLGDLGGARLYGEGPADAWGTDGYVDPAVLDGAPVRQAGDVYGIGALAWFALTGQAPGLPPQPVPLQVLAPSTPPALVEVVEAALRPDPAQRPGAARLAVELFDAVAPEPVRLSRPASAVGNALDPLGGSGPPEEAAVTRQIRRAAERDPVPEQPPPRWWQVRGTSGDETGGSRRRALLLPGAVVTLVVLAVLTGGVLRWWPPPEDPATAAEGTPATATRTPLPAAADAAADPPEGRGDPPGTAVERLEAAELPEAGEPPEVAGDRSDSGEDLREVVAALAAARAQALTTLDDRYLEQVNLPGSAAMQADAALVQQLRHEGVRLDGLEFDVLRVERVAAGTPAEEIAVAGPEVGARVDLEVDVVTSAHRRVPLAGSSLAGASLAGSAQKDRRGTEVPRGQVRTSVLSLARAPQGWRVEQVR